jgi:hypothetical protein
MAIAQRVNGTGQYYVASPSGPTTVSRPAAVQAGDVAIVVGAANAVTWVTPAGWSVFAANVTVGGMYVSVWYRVILSGDTSWAFSTSSLNTVSLIFVAFTGVNTSVPLDTAGSGNTSSSSQTVTASSITIANSGAFWMHAVAAIQPNGTNPQFSATGFTEYDNGALTYSLAYPVGLLWQGPMSSGATGTTVISSTRASGASQYLIAVPFALDATPPTTVSAVAVSAVQTAGNDLEKVIASEPAIGATAETSIGFVERLLEDSTLRLLEDHSLRLMEGSALVPAVTVIVQSHSQAMTGFAGTISIPTIVTSASAVAVVATGFASSIGVRDLVGTAATIAAGIAATTQVTASIATSSVVASGFVGSISTADIIGSTAVFASGITGAGSLTIGGGVYLAAGAVAVSGYTALAGITELIDLGASTATGSIGIITLDVGGSTSLSVIAVNATSWTGMTGTAMAVAPGVAVMTGTVPSLTASTGIPLGTVGSTAWVGTLGLLAGMSQVTVMAGFSAGLLATSEIIALASSGASGFVGTVGGNQFAIGSAVGFTALAGSVIETVEVNQPAVNGIWFLGSAVAIQIFNVSASAVEASAFSGITQVTIAIDAPATLATAWASTVIAIPAPPLDTGAGIAVRIPVDQFGGPLKIVPCMIDEFASSAIAVRMPADQFGGPHLTVVTTTGNNSNA